MKVDNLPFGILQHENDVSFVRSCHFFCKNWIVKENNGWRLKGPGEAEPVEHIFHLLVKNNSITSRCTEHVGFKRFGQLSSMKLFFKVIQLNLWQKCVLREDQMTMKDFAAVWALVMQKAWSLSWTHSPPNVISWTWSTHTFDKCKECTWSVTVTKIDSLACTPPVAFVVVMVRQIKFDFHHSMMVFRLWARDDHHVASKHSVFNCSVRQGNLHDSWILCLKCSWIGFFCSWQQVDDQFLCCCVVHIICVTQLHSRNVQKRWTKWIAHFKTRIFGFCFCNELHTNVPSFHLAAIWHILESLKLCFCVCHCCCCCSFARTKLHQQSCCRHGWHVQMCMRLLLCFLASSDISFGFWSMVFAHLQRKTSKHVRSFWMHMLLVFSHGVPNNKISFSVARPFCIFPCKGSQLLWQLAQLAQWLLVVLTAAAAMQTLASGDEVHNWSTAKVSV